MQFLLRTFAVEVVFDRNLDCGASSVGELPIREPSRLGCKHIRSSLLSFPRAFNRVIWRALYLLAAIVGKADMERWLDPCWSTFL
jgi:hypothetical protein